MTERHWRGVTKKEHADEYVHYLINNTFPQIATIEGFHSARILKRQAMEGCEFLIITEWASEEAIKKFAGPNSTLAVVPEIVQKMMIRYDDIVVHYETGYKITAAELSSL